MKPIYRLPAFVAVALFALWSPLPVAKAETNDTKEAGTPSQPQQRIVAAGGVITEIIYALGHADLLAGVDSTSQFPAMALKSKPNIGYVRALSSEGILSLHPNLVIAIEGAGPPDVLKAVEDAGVPVHRVREVPTPEGVAEKITEVAALIGEKTKGDALAKETEARLKSVDSLRAKITKAKRALFILSFQNGRAMVGGVGTPADGILKLAGLVNSAADIEGWKAIGDEAVITAQPDVLIAMSHGPQSITRDSILAAPAFAATPAAKSGSVLVLDGGHLLSFGPRTPDAAHDLMIAAYPELAQSGEVPKSQ